MRDRLRSVLGGQGPVAEVERELMDAHAAAVAAARSHFPAPPRRWLVTGGGRHNPALMEALSRALGVPVEPVERVGWDGDALEARAFAYLAVRSLDGLPLSFPAPPGSSGHLPAGASLAD